MSRSDAQELHAAIRKVLPSFDCLAPRQRQVADLLVVGKTGKQIADALGISIQTEKNHATAIYRKLGITDGGALRFAQARIALSARYIDLAREKARDVGYATGYRHGYVDGLEHGRAQGRKAALAEIAQRCSVCPLR
jgi:hypothetical protein